MTKGQRIAFQIMQWIVVVMFVFQGGVKLLGLSFEVEAFMKWGYPLWFMYVLGVLELAGAIGLFTKLRTYAAAGLTLLMVGAIYTHLTNNEAQFIGLAALMIVLLVTTTWLKRKSQAVPTATPTTGPTA